MQGTCASSEQVTVPLDPSERPYRPRGFEVGLEPEHVHSALPTGELSVRRGDCSRLRTCHGALCFLGRRLQYAPLANDPP